jgi:flagellar assembly factor FliW
VIVKTGRFGQLTIDDQDVITIPTGVLGFPEYTKFCLVDAADDTLILWLQSLDNPEIAFAVLEPKVFRTEYAVRLSGAELRELKLENVNQSAVFSILTIPSDVTQMTANLKAPIVINLRERIAKQVVLQENEYSIKHLMFKELRSHLITIQSQASDGKPAQVTSVAVKNIPPSLTVKTLQA